MNEEKYTRDAKKESSRKKRVEPENKTRKKSHADKLKNETSAGESYRKKLRYGKKDNALTVEEAKKLQQSYKMQFMSGVAIYDTSEPEDEFQASIIAEFFRVYYNLED